ncbi:methyltransferase [Streptomyces sp. DSM 44915]|uniref:Protein-L-isoaspartate O-methyltransferase n=1 Tax=Streptomyces chisholmiae TaxID=3075540 RepID=A0ABU2JVI2_9ACTN|nr:methyltransferase domain-containing protein [Streptomyces sp. DSM 44915]MDT0268998.1 methyltransferase [Streptomyces sp. DSM 44915]
MTTATGGCGPAGLAAAVAAHLGRAVPPEWLAALEAVPRDRFLPSRVWLRDGHGGYRPCDRAAEPDRWRAAAWADGPVVVRVTEEPDGTVRPLSSASAPGTVLAMLAAADVRPGARVLEIGTGTGWHAGLLAARAGDAGVVSVELDGDLVAPARAALAAVGRHPLVRQGDGADGWPAGAPYDRIIATCSVRAVPAAWVDQLAPGGRLVTPWASAWCAYGTLVAEPTPDGTLRGRWLAGGSYLPLRARADAASGTVAAGPDPLAAPAEAAGLSPWAVAGDDYQAQAVTGLLTPGVWHVWDGADDEPGVHARLWLYAEDDAGTAVVEVASDGTTTARQAGERRLWDEVVAGWRWWREAGAPALSRFGLTRSAEGTVRVWLDTPDRPVPRR